MPDLIELTRGPVYVFGELRFDSGHRLPVALPPNEWAALWRALSGASYPSDPTATSSPEGDGGHPVEALRGSGPRTPSPLTIEGCTCPWNNGYVVPAVVRHHLICPTLKKQHHPHDDCKSGGHRDAEVVNVTNDAGVWVVINSQGGTVKLLAKPRLAETGTWDVVPYV